MDVIYHPLTTGKPLVVLTKVDLTSLYSQILKSVPASIRCKYQKLTLSPAWGQI